MAMCSDILRTVPAHAVTERLARLEADLPPQWRQETIGPGIEEWQNMTVTGRAISLQFTGLPLVIRTEMAWMAHWLIGDGCKVAVAEFNQAAAMLRWALETKKISVDSVVELDRAVCTRLYGSWFESRRSRLPAQRGVIEFQRLLFGYPRLALLARVHEGLWWELDAWVPRCDPRIPLRSREPLGSEGCRPGQAQIPWLRDVIKWHLGTALEAGLLTWSTISSDRTRALLLFDRWLSTLEHPADLTANVANATALAASFRRWIGSREKTEQATTREVNKSLRAVVELMVFIDANRDECCRLFGPSPWESLTDAHPAIWRKQIIRRHRQPLLNDDHYVDEHALAQITAWLPVLGAETDETMTVTVGGVERVVSGCGNQQVMRMLLLQMLTGRRVSEICLCAFDCLAPAPGGASAAAEGEQVARFCYAQSKIDHAPDAILVDAEVVAVIEEQQRWVRERFAGVAPRYLFPQRMSNTEGTKHVSSSNYRRVLRDFSARTEITDSRGRRICLSRTHRFRHTRITRLAELGLPVHVLQRYAGHASPTMSMHYVARREEHAEQAFLATRKFRSDGTVLTFSREDHDGMHLFERADRFLPHGYCLLPPLQTCDKGNSCLTCSVFVTDTSHSDTLRRQLVETEALIERTTTQFQRRHGVAMPEDNVWLAQRTAERDALTRLLAVIGGTGGACQGAGSPSSGPTPITIDTTRHRKTQS